MSLSDDLRDELAQIAPDRRCCRLAELSALFHSSGAWHLRDGTVAVHLDLISSAIARRAFALLRDLGVRSEIRTYPRRVVRARDPLPAPRHGRRERARGAARGRRALRPRARRSRCRRSAWSDDRAAAAPISAVRCSAPGRSPARATRTSRSAPATLEARGSSRTWRGARTARSPSPSGAATRSRTRRGTTRSAPCSPSPGRATPRSCSRSTRSSRRCARTRTGSRTPTRRTSNAPRERRTASSRRSGRSASTRCPPTSSRSPNCAFATPRRRSRELAAKARPPLTKSAAHRRLQAVTRLVET